MTAPQVHCVQAYGRLLGVLQATGPFPAGLVLHSWAGPLEMVPPLVAIDGVHFSVSGHVTRVKLAKARATVAAVRQPLSCVCSLVRLSYSGKPACGHLLRTMRGS